VNALADSLRPGRICSVDTQHATDHRHIGHPAFGKSLRDAHPEGHYLTVQEAPSAQQSDKFLLTAYRDDRQRAHAIRCLGWIACHMGPSERLDWWKIPDWVPPRQIRLARRLVMCAILAVDAAVLIAVTSWVWALFFLGIIAFISCCNNRGKRRSAVVRRRTASVSYRADRRNSMLYGLACAPLGAFMGVLAFSPAYGTPGWLAGTLLSALTVSVGIWIVRGSSYSLLKLTELALAVRWHERADFLGVLKEAEDKEVLLRSSAGYLVFRDSALRKYLADMGEAASSGQGREDAVGLGRTGIRFKSIRPSSWFTRFKASQQAWVTRLLRRALIQPEPGKTSRNRVLSAVSGWLSKSRIDRLTFDFGVGTVIAVLTGYLLRAIPEGTAIPTLVVDALFAPLFGFAIAAVASKGMLQAASHAACKGAVYAPLISRKARIGAVAAALAVGVALIATVGTFLADALAFLLPTAFVTACGLWLCVLTFRKWCTSPRRWLRRVPDQVAIATSAAALLVGTDRELLTTQWATVLLFPVAIVGSLRLWTVMRKTKRLIIRAGADIALSLLLGGELVLFLVWLANVLGMPRAEVSLIRTGFSSTGSYAGVYDGGRMWASIYATLAVASVILVLYPVRLKRLTKWFDRLSLAQVASTAQRVLIGLYVGILTIVFVGIAGPDALTPTLHRQLTATYVVALQRQLEMDAEATAYNEIREEINQLTPPGTVSVLIYLIQAIHHDANQKADAHGGTRAEEALAYRVGHDQAAAIDLPNPPTPASGGQAAADSADLSKPTHDAPELSSLATETAAGESADDQARARLKTALELAVSAAANFIPIPNVSKNEVAQIATQFLSGLIDDTKVTEVFEAWLEHTPHSEKPPSAEVLVVPDPDNLDNAAQADLNHAAITQDVTVLPSGVLPDPSASIAEIDQSLIDDAVSTASQAQEIQETGTCADCINLGSNDNVSHDDDNPDTHVDG